MGGWVVNSTSPLAFFLLHPLTHLPTHLPPPDSSVASSSSSSPRPSSSSKKVVALPPFNKRPSQGLRAHFLSSLSSLSSPFPALRKRKQRSLASVNGGGGGEEEEEERGDE